MVVFNSMFKAKTIVMLPRWFTLKDLGHTLHSPKVYSIEFALKLGGILQK